MSKSRLLGLWPAARLALRGPDLCAPRCHARAHVRGPGRLRLRRRCCLPVADHPLVGGLGLLGELALGGAHLLRGSPRFRSACPCVGNRRMSPTAARNVAAQITLTPGTVISRRTSPDSSASTATSRSTSAISASRNSTWRMQAATVSDSSTGSSSPAQPLAPLDAEQIRHRRAAGQPTHEHGVDLVLRPRPCAHQLLTPPKPPAQHARPLIRRPDAVELASREQPGQYARVEAVGLRPGLADTGISRADHDDPGDMRLEDPRDLPRAARSPPTPPDRSAQDSTRTAPTAPASSRSDPQSEPRPPRRSRPRRNRGARPTQSTCRPISPRPLYSSTNWRTSGRTTTTDTCSQHIRASRRGGHRVSPSSKLIVQNGLPNHVLQKAPVPVNRP